MIYEYSKNISCFDSLQCSNNIVAKLETPKLKLKALKKTDTVNGYVTIHHEAGNHSIRVVIYDKDENPNKEHSSTLKKPSIIPTRKEIENKISLTNI